MGDIGRHILSIEGLDVSYGGVQAVSGVMIGVSAGEIVGIVGESGSGKSTVLRAVAGLLGRSGRIDAGSILFEGRELVGLPQREKAALRGARIAYVFQDSVGSLDPLWRVGRQFDECLSVQGVASGHVARAIELNLLEEMGFDDPERVLKSYPHELSGGMCQRVVLAMAVASNPSLLLADEPTSALDVAAQIQVNNLLSRIRADHGTSLLVVSHNIGAIAQIADRIGVMYRGEMVELGIRDQVLHAPQHPYTQMLIDAVPRFER